VDDDGGYALDDHHGHLDTHVGEHNSDPGKDGAGRKGGNSIGERDDEDHDFDPDGPGSAYILLDHYRCRVGSFQALMATHFHRRCYWFQPPLLLPTVCRSS